MVNAVKRVMHHQINGSQLANTILKTQKLKTGLAILGQPPPEIIMDKKMQGKLIRAAQLAGEDLALNSLTSELYILIVLKMSFVNP